MENPKLLSLGLDLFRYLKAEVLKEPPEVLKETKKYHLSQISKVENLLNSIKEDPIDKEELRMFKQELKDLKQKLEHVNE